MIRSRLVGLVLAVSVAALTQPNAVAERSGGAGRTPGASRGATGTEGLSFRLSEAEDKPEASEVLTRPATERMTDEETKHLLERLPPLGPEPADEKLFALREGSPPPPRTGKTVATVLPPPDDSKRPEPAKGPLTVVRRSPEGAVPLAPYLSVTFSLPMVEVTSQDAAASVRPVKLDPEPAGQWRWLGTRPSFSSP